MKLRGLLTAAQNELLADLHRRDDDERQRGIREASSLKALSPEVAELLYVLILQNNAKTIVEYGTSHGYSTIHLAAAAEQTEGHVHSVDLLPEKTALATDNLQAAGLLHRVTLATADATEFTATLPDSIDLVLVDIAIPAFAPAFDALRGRVRPGGSIFIDGGPPGYWGSDGVREFRLHLENDPAFLVSILGMKKDHLMAVVVPEAVAGE